MSAWGPSVLYIGLPFFLPTDVSGLLRNRFALFGRVFALALLPLEAPNLLSICPALMIFPIVSSEQASQEDNPQIFLDMLAEDFDLGYSSHANDGIVGRSFD